MSTGRELELAAVGDKVVGLATVEQPSSAASVSSRSVGGENEEVGWPK